jgi:hypothetical protein
MKNIKAITLSLFVLATVIVTSGLTKNTGSCQYSEDVSEVIIPQNQTINMFVTHGHCSTPFGGIVENLNVITNKREDGGNPLEDMQISFELDPNKFNACRGDDLTSRVKTPGLFIGENDEKITFTTTNVYTMGMDWYQVNGYLSIKGIEKEVKLFATGIRDQNASMSSALVLEGQMDLFDWGIDYDKIVTGKSDLFPTKWMYLNMKIDLTGC